MSRVHDLNIADMTEGTLNAAKFNAVLMVTAISGNHQRTARIPGAMREPFTTPMLR